MPVIRRISLRIVLTVGLGLTGGAIAHAQTGSNAPQGNSQTDPLAAPSQPIGGAASSETPSLGDEMDDPISDSVDVSLGDWELKNKLADQLKIKISKVPLTVSVSPEIAADVCPIGGDDLAQQKTISPTRTCAAKSLSPDLLDAVRQQVTANSDADAGSD